MECAFCSTHRADGSLHDRIKSCLRGVQVSRGLLLAYFSSERLAVAGQAQDVFVGERCSAVSGIARVLQILWSRQYKGHDKLLQK